MDAAGIQVGVLNRQRAFRVGVRRLEALAVALLGEELRLARAVLGIRLVGPRVMASLNWQWLRHRGSTDILTFDHREPENEPRGGDVPDLHGDLVISVADAVTQAREFGTTPSLELVRYVVHGVLHLRGYDDLESEPRRRMKREEDRLVRRLCRRFPVRGLVVCRA